MRKLVKFRLNRECREIAVNPDKVLWVCHYEHGASTLHFGKDCHVRVQGDLEVVVETLEAALCRSSSEMSEAAGEQASKMSSGEPRSGIN